MKKNHSKTLLIAQFIISVVAYLAAAPIEVWLLLSLLFLTNIANSIIYTIETRFPLIEYVVFFFYLQNVLCLTLLLIANSIGVEVDMQQTCNTDIIEFLPFVFLSVQAIYLGYSVFQKKNNDWLIFFTNMEKLVPVKKLHLLIGVGIFGGFLKDLGISELEYVATILESFLKCALIILLMHKDYKYKKLLYVAIIYLLAKSLSTGLIGESISFIFTIAIYKIIIRRINGERINWLFIGGSAVVGIILVAFLQNIKGDYRDKTWQGQEEADLTTFYGVAETKKETFDPTSFEFYFGILYRLNQSGISSSTLNTVPYKIPFEDGATISRSIVDAFVPRALNPDKEKAGGREKYEKYTGRRLIGQTSMNIGLIGEGYINFGKEGAVVLFFFYGLFLSLFENKILKLSRDYPAALVFIPFYISSLIATENDFMIVLNALVKGTLIIIAFIYYAGFKKKRSRAVILAGE